MDLEALKEELEGLSEKDLFRYLRKLICKMLSESQSPIEDTNEILDMVYSECQIRGKERLYDKTFESVSNNPDICETGLLTTDKSVTADVA